jgi:hypothetical protein
VQKCISYILSLVYRGRVCDSFQEGSIGRSSGQALQRQESPGGRQSLRDSHLRCAAFPQSNLTVSPAVANFAMEQDFLGRPLNSNALLKMFGASCRSESVRVKAERLRNVYNSLTCTVRCDDCCEVSRRTVLDLWMRGSFVSISVDHTFQYV